MKLMLVLLMLVGGVAWGQDEEVAPAPVQEAPIKKKGGKSLRKREHHLTWDYSNVKTKIEIEDDDDDSDTTNTELSIGYGYNWGHWEAGGELSMSGVDAEGSDTDTQALSVFGRYNFIKNARGKDLVPYGALSLIKMTMEIDVGGADVEADGTGFGAEVGLSWLPFGELYSVDVAYFYSSIDGEIEAGGQSVDAKMKQSGLLVGYSIWF